MAHRTSRNHRRKRILPRLLLAAVLIALLFPVFFRWSNTSLQTEHAEISLSRLPRAFDALTVAHLSDLHGASFGEDNADLIAAVAESAPDLIVITGDLVDQHQVLDSAALSRFAAELAAVAPTYFVTGNHEWARDDVKEIKALLSDSGVTVLSNGAVTLARGESEIVLAGIDDPNGFADQKTPEQLAEEIRAAADDPFWILLAHRNNLFASRYSLLGADLVLSGHGHGGLVRLPFTDGLVSPERTFFPDYTAGLYEENGSALFVSRGLGNSGDTFRLFNRPHLAILTLRCA